MDLFIEKIVLDHGFVRLLNITDNPDLSIVRAARVSYAADWRAGSDEDKDAKLINYLWKNRHTSPFEAVNITFEIKAPIFVFRQWHRHRTWSYNEVSARYTELPEEYYIPTIETVGTQSTKNKQQRIIATEPLTENEIFSIENANREAKKHCEHAFFLYRNFMEKGWPRELARMVLPVNTYSRMFATVDMNNFFKFLLLRDNDHAQYEIRQYAITMKEAVLKVAPFTMAAFNGNR